MCVSHARIASERACILMYLKHWDDYVWANGRDLVLCTYAQNSALKIVGLYAQRGATFIAGGCPC